MFTNKVKKFVFLFLPRVQTFEPSTFLPNPSCQNPDALFKNKKKHKQKSFYLSFYLSFYSSFYLTIFLPLFLYIYLSIFPPIFLSFYLSIYQSSLYSVVEAETCGSTRRNSEGSGSDLDTPTQF